jgi:SAM-dependent methyltransferase
LESVHVLGVGCGDGALGSVLARRGARVTGLDPDARMLAADRRRAQADGIALALVPGEAEALPFADTFDRVVAVTVLCFVEDAYRAIGEMARVLRPGGKLVIGELGRWGLWAAMRRIRGRLGAPTWKAPRFRSARELRRLLTAHGLSIEQTAGAIYCAPAGMAASLLARYMVRSPDHCWRRLHRVVGDQARSGESRRMIRPAVTRTKAALHPSSPRPRPRRVAASPPW